MSVSQSWLRHLAGNLLSIGVLQEVSRHRPKDGAVGVSLLEVESGRPRAMALAEACDLVGHELHCCGDVFSVMAKSLCVGHSGSNNRHHLHLCS